MPTVEAVSPILFVRDLGRAVDWYVRVLGCRVAFRAPDYAGVGLGPVTILLSTMGPVRQGGCHLRVATGVDDYAAAIEAAGQPLAATVKDRPEYGMREFCVRDPDGNDLYVGQDA